MCQCWIPWGMSIKNFPAITNKVNTDGGGCCIMANMIKTPRSGVFSKQQVSEGMITSHQESRVVAPYHRFTEIRFAACADSRVDYRGRICPSNIVLTYANDCFPLHILSTT